MKKFICTVCGYIHEGDAAPEKCPLCKAPASKFNEMVETEGGLEFADQHVIGVAKGCDEEMIKDLNNHFMGECTEVGMYLAMSRLSNVTLGKKQNMLLSLLSCWVTVYGIQRLTWKRE